MNEFDLLMSNIVQLNVLQVINVAKSEHGSIIDRDMTLILVHQKA